MRRLIKGIVIVLITTLLTSASIVCAATAKTTSIKSKAIRILFIGSSLTSVNNMPIMLAEIAKSKGKNLVADMSGASFGTGLTSHWDGGTTRKFITKGKWDYVSMESYTYGFYFDKYLRLFVKDIKDIGAKPLLYESNVNKGLDGKPDPIQERNMYNLAKRCERDLGGIFVPACRAWIKLSEIAPDIDLYLPNDTVHANQTGAYLTACVFYASIFNESPEGASSKFKTGEYTDTDGKYKDIILDLSSKPELVKLLQKTAWETVKEYRAM